jgi:hypothetical protein
MRRIGLAVVLALGLILAPLAVEAQQAEKVYRIGFLSQGSGAPGDGPKGSMSGSLPWRPTWCGSGWTSS